MHAGLFLHGKYRSAFVCFLILLHFREKHMQKSSVFTDTDVHVFAASVSSLLKETKG